ncbi:MAG: site-2 protease family protein [Alphaproteobacteria bacterium]
MNSIYFEVATWVIPVLIAITLHEAAHGWVADKLGDDTARRMGRVSFNPLRHVDLVGTILLPALLIATKAGFVFGWAKPVPVNFSRLRNPRRDMVLVAAAGPAANFLIACGAAVLWHLHAVFPEGVAEFWYVMMIRGILLNLMIGAFNLLPLPPLDGGRILTGLLPRPYAVKFARIERYGFFILIGALILLPLLGEQIGVSLNPLAWILLPIVNAAAWLIFTIFGIG